MKAGMKRMGKTISAAFVVMVMMTAIMGCGRSAGESAEYQGAVSPFVSFRDIPGVTAQEIAAVETLQQAVLQRQTDALIYGMTAASEAFAGEDGEVHGFTALFCNWMTDLFGIPFKPAIYEWGDLIGGLENGTIDFVGNLTASDERRKTYFMTDPIARRSIRYIRLANSRPLDEIASTRPLRHAFLKGANTLNLVSPHLKNEYISFFVDDYGTVYDMLKNGEVDSVIIEGPAEAAFDIYGNVVSSDFFPLIYTPVSLSTRKPALEPVITVVQKALETAGTTRFLVALYNNGQQEYLRHKLFTQLSEEERLYIRDHPVVPFAAETDNYPVSFYNAREKQWQGIALEVLKETESLTGLRFRRVNNERAGWTTILGMLENGEVSLTTELVQSAAREGKFLWSDAVLMMDNPALISKPDYPNIQLNEIPYVRVGLIKDYGHTESFWGWFPDHSNTAEYESSLAAFNAMDRGEVDMVMTSNHALLIMTHFMERPDYKANIVFNFPFKSTFGFNKDEVVLHSIVDKALRLVDIETISNHWMRKTYNYRANVAEARLPWLIGASVLSLVVLSLILIMFFRKRYEGKRLGILVAEKTATLTEALEQRKAAEEAARTASEAKSRFIANMSHEMRTPMNVIVGLTDLMLEEDAVSTKAKEALKKINIAGTTLMGLISDVLDISKIEAGKLDLVPVAYDLPSLFNDIVTLNMIRIEGKPIVFNLNINKNLPCTLFGDDLRVKQILNNLLSNAFKYTKEGTVTLNTDYRHEGSNVWISFSVSDTGIGIRAEDLPRLFSDYNQVDTGANREIEGTGLGLSITKKFVELMDGEITVESEYGKGTTFHVLIRQGFVTSTPIGTETAENLRNFCYADTKKLVQERLIRSDLSYARVLVVDDFPTNLDVAAGMLRKYKMQVDCVTRGQDAVDLIAAGTPVYTAVFMDHMMPGMDGMESTAAIRAVDTEYAKTIPIIALTANAVAGNEQMFLDNGFNAFLSKPLNVMTLDSVIHRWIKKK
jgi:signal transduction histidine kinase